MTLTPERHSVDITKLQRLICENNRWFNTRPAPTPCPQCGKPSVLCAMGAPPCLACTMHWSDDDV